jgi:hypothetical protein
MVGYWLLSLQYRVPPSPVLNYAMQTPTFPIRLESEYLCPPASEGAQFMHISLCLSLIETRLRTPPQLR